jgi:hypothetical protein
MSIAIAADPRSSVEVVADSDVETIIVGDVGPPGVPGPPGPPGQDGSSGASTAAELPLTPGGTVSATNVQNAILELDAEKVARAGDVMSGHLTLPVGPAAANAVRRDYVDAADSALSAGKADKTYTDAQDALKVAKAGDTMSGHLALPTGPAAANAVRKDYVDAADGVLSTNKADKTYVDTQDALKVAKAGDTMAGHLTLPTGPAAANAVRKDYVDAADTALGTAKVNKAGDVMSGILDITMSFPSIRLNKSASGESSLITGRLGTAPRWQMALGDLTAEGGSNSGSDFYIRRFDDSGTLIDSPLTINRATGKISTTGAGLKFGTYIVADADIFCCGATTATGLPGVGNTVAGACFSMSGGAMLAVSRNAGFGAAAFINVNAAGTNTQWQCAGVTVGSIAVTATTTAYNTSSDARLKEDLKSFDAGNIVDDTNVYDFMWQETGVRDFGVIAQEAKDVYPTATFYQEDIDRWFIDYSKYVPVILQELKTLRARIAALEGQLAAKP